MKYFKCFSAQLAGYLRKQGFMIIGTEVNLKNPQYDIFLFEDSEELRKAFQDYCK